ncbi:DNA-binding MarR family transcriptional regulator [Diaminobutyricimonas aerilata]|uniref:DNA-binding MarR family transcriptional regulator n=1 Tax=Diaminobutyricimonas aerilata TaxID=1162967 RepID=A0A2M9CF77_9MICO|nr:MarR family transcriptional regulator [Diaminobutyricimonas aerilata]PJJ70591.1 DNA-binding MarR family transcriptional regulator [Diaminobutyricimonas aerilata]
MTEVSEVSPAEWGVWREFYGMRRQLDRALERDLQRASGISGPDYEVLLALFEAPARELRARQLAELLGWEKSRLSHQLTRMVARDLVSRRECDSDGRGTWVGLTTNGRRAVLGAMRDHALRIREYFFDAMTPDELELLGDISRRVLRRMDAPTCDEIDSEASVSTAG